MGATQPRLSIQGATDEILRRQGAAGARYGRLYAPPPGDIVALRQQQAAFARTRADLDRRNSWMAIPAVAPALAVLGLEGAALLGARSAAAGAGVGGRPLALMEPEPWFPPARPSGQPPIRSPGGRLREKGRQIWAKANEVEATKLDAHVHHSDPLEFSHVKPRADPNRLANLWALSPEEHAIATREWGAFSRGLKGREPTQAELMEAKLRIDRLVAPYVRRSGASRPNPPPPRKPK
jgi:hypothetical protein